LKALGPPPAVLGGVEVLKVDADAVGGDDAAHALRYLVATKARTVEQRKLRGLRPPHGPADRISDF